MDYNGANRRFKIVIAEVHSLATNLSEFADVQAESNTATTDHQDYELTLSLDKPSYEIGEMPQISWDLNQPLVSGYCIVITEKGSDQIVYRTNTEKSGTTTVELHPGYSPGWTGYFEDTSFVGYVSENCSSGFVPRFDVFPYNKFGVLSESNEAKLTWEKSTISISASENRYANQDGLPEIKAELSSDLAVGLGIFIVDTGSGKIIKKHINSVNVIDQNAPYDDWEWDSSADPGELIGNVEPFASSEQYQPLQNSIELSHKYKAILGSYNPGESYNYLSDIEEIRAESEEIEINRTGWEKLDLSAEIVGDFAPYLHLTLTANQHHQPITERENEGTYLIDSNGYIIDGNYFDYENSEGFEQKWNMPWDPAITNIRAVKAFPNPNASQITSIDNLIVIATSPPISTSLAMDKWRGGFNPSDASCEQTCLGDPVNSFTGEFFEHQEDLAIEGVIPFSFTRGYSTFNRTEMGSFGRGWTNNYAMKLTHSANNLTEANSITLVQENGSIVEFFKSEINGVATYETTADVRAELQKVDTGFRFQRPGDNRSYIFNDYGVLQTIEDRNGNYLTLTYDTFGFLNGITSSDGKSIIISLNSAHRITSITDGTRTVNYSYVAGRLSSVQTSDTTAPKTYNYDGSNRVASVTHPNGGVYLNEYDSEDRVVKQTNPLGGETLFDYSQDTNLDRTTLITLPDGAQIREKYTSQGRIIEKEFGYGNSNSALYSYTYDSSGRKISESSPLGAIVRYSYDAKGNVLTVTDPLNRVTSFTYNQFDQIVEKINALNEITTNNYDAAGNLVSTVDANGNSTAFEVNPNGTANSVTTAQDLLEGNGKKILFNYDANGYLNSTTSAEGYTSSTLNDNIGLPLKSTDPLGRETDYTYNSRKQPIKVELPTGGEQTSTYDAAGRLETSTDELGRVTFVSYDSMDNVISRTDSYGTTNYDYDNMQRLVKLTNPDGSEVQYAYDFLGRLVKVTDENGNETVNDYRKDSLLMRTLDASGKYTAYLYDAAGNTLSVRRDFVITQRMTYDALNRITQLTLENGYKENYTYDAAGNRTGVTKADLETTTYEYDAENRLVKTNYPDQSSELRAYNSDGNLIAVTDRDGALTNYEYDSGSQLVKVIKPGSAEQLLSYTDGGQIDQISYDAWTSIDSDYNYDMAGRITEELKGGVATTYSYDAIGNMTRRGPPTGAGVEYSYDQYGELTNLTYPSGLELSYEHDAAGNLTSVNRGTETLISYEYNSLGLPSKASYGNGVDQDLT